MGQEVIEDALVIAARYELQGLSIGERQILNSVDRVARSMLKLEASGQINPFRDIGRDLLAANRAFRAGNLDLAQLNESLQGARIQMNELRDAGIEPDARALNVLSNAIDRTAVALARMNAQGKGGKKGPLEDLDEQQSRIAKGGAGFDAGIARARSGLAQLAVTSVGASSAVGQVAQGMLLLGGSSVKEIIFAAGGVAILGAAMELLTKQTREATKAREALNTALKSRVEGARGDEGQIQAEIAAAEEKRALNAREIAKINTEIAQSEFTILGVKQKGLFTLANEFRLRKLNTEQTKQQLLLDEALALLKRQQANASTDLTRDLLLGGERLRQQALDTAAATAKTRQQIAGQQTPTFGPQPGTISQQEQAALEQNVRLTKEATDQAIRELKIRLDAAQKQEALTKGEREEKAKQIGLLQQEIELRRRAGAISVQQLKDELAITAAMRERELREKALANLAEARIAEFGPQAGNQFGPRPSLALPTDADVSDLAQKLARIPPIGMPRAQAIADEFKKARELATPDILKGSAAFEPPTPTTAPELLGHAGDFKQAVDQIIEARRQTKLWEAALRAAETPAERLADAFSGVGEFDQSLVKVGQDLGFIGDQAAQTIDAVGALGDALAKALANASTGNILGAFAAGASLLGGLFHGDDEQKRLLKENSDRLADLAVGLERFQGPQGLQNLQAFADIGKRVSEGGRGFIGLEQALAEAGITLDAFARTVKEQTGIEILDKKGHIVAGSMEQLRKATELAAAATLKFGTDIQSRQDFLANNDRIFGNPNRTDTQQSTDALARARDVQLGALHLSDAEEEWVKSLNLGTREGREAFKKWEQGLATRAKQGLLTPEELGDFKGVAELFGTLADTVDTLNDSMKQLTVTDLQQARDVQSKLGLGGTGDPSLDAVNQARDNLVNALTPDPALQATLRNIDLSTIQGRKQFLEIERNLFKRAVEGGLTPEELAKLSPDELIKLLGEGADAVNAFTKSITAATNVNLPQGFKLAKDAFDAMAFGPSRPGDGASLPPFVPVQPPPAAPTSHRGTDLNPVVAVDSVTIHVNESKTPQETAAAIRRELQKIGLVQSGDTLQLGVR